MACFSYEYLILFNEDGSGDGVIEVANTFPIELFKEPDSVQTYMDNMLNDGWEDVSMQEIEDKYIFSGNYPFFADPTKNNLRDIFPELGVKVEQSENEYIYFTVDGNIDLTDISELWNEIKNVWAVDGIVLDSDVLGYKKGDEIFSADEVQSLIDKYGDPYIIVRMRLPGQTPVEANSFWNNEQDFMSGDTNILEFTWTPDVRLSTPVKAVRRIEPLTYVTKKEADSQISEIIKLYKDEIESGNAPSDTRFSGFLNNWLIQPFWGGSFTCSEYQHKITLFLDKIRTNPDPEIRSLLNGLDYGPIDTNHEGHLAMVLYQRGTDWKKTGIVLDPWPTQTPQAFPISEWAGNVWGYDASSPNVDHESGQFYPHLSGGIPSYPAATDAKGDLSVEKLLALRTQILYMG